jgi:shikimate kinase
VNKQRVIRNIALIGFMGTGKSTVGRILAEQLGFAFVDTDELIEQHAGKPISRIFSEEGETAFREYERRLLAELCSRVQLIISTGGGLAANEENLASLKTHALVICLWASPRTVYERVRAQTHRPLLQTGDPQARIQELLRARERFYREADVLVNTELRSVKEVAQHVLHQFRLATRAPRAE